MKNEKKMTQQEAVLEHLKTKGSLSSLQAIRLYGCTRLSARILQYKKQGYKFETTNKTTKNRYGYHCTYAVYKLIKGEN